MISVMHIGPGCERVVHDLIDAEVVNRCPRTLCTACGSNDSFRDALLIATERAATVFECTRGICNRFPPASRTHARTLRFQLENEKSKPDAGNWGTRTAPNRVARNSSMLFRMGTRKASKPNPLAKKAAAERRVPQRKRRP